MYIYIYIYIIYNYYNSDINDSIEEFINIILFNKDNFSSTKQINLNSEYKPWLSQGLKK